MLSIPHKLAKGSAAHFILLGLLSLLVLLLSACQDQIMQPLVQGKPIYGVDANNNLIRFGSMRPDSVTNRKYISGLQDSEYILGIDFRPVDGRLYGVSNFNLIYVIDTVSAVALPARSTAFPTLLNGTFFGFGFNPVPDKIRIHSNAEQDLRIDPVTGVLARDSTLAYDFSDVYFGFNPNIVGTAYTNSVAGAIITSLFAIDSNLDVLVTLPSPNNGKLVTIGDLGVNTNDYVGFDISGPDGVAYASLTPASNGSSGFYRINLATGAATLLGPIGNFFPLHSIAIAP